MRLPVHSDAALAFISPHLPLPGEESIILRNGRLQVSYDIHDHVGKALHNLWEESASPNGHYFKKGFHWRGNDLYESGRYCYAKGFTGAYETFRTRMWFRTAIAKWLRGDLMQPVTQVLSMTFGTASDYIARVNSGNFGGFTFECVAKINNAVPPKPRADSFPIPPSQHNELSKAHAERDARDAIIANAKEISHNYHNRRRSMIWRCVYQCGADLNNMPYYYKVYAGNELTCCRVATTHLANPKLIYSDLISIPKQVTPPS